MQIFYSYLYCTLTFIVFFSHLFQHIYSPVSSCSHEHFLNTFLSFQTVHLDRCVFCDPYMQRKHFLFKPFGRIFLAVHSQYIHSAVCWMDCPANGQVHQFPVIFWLLTGLADTLVGRGAWRHLWLIFSNNQYPSPPPLYHWKEMNHF